MFPLEHAILPTSVIPLHIFEPRYRAFAADVTPRPDPEFGIAPIERGREVGGDDVRADVAVVARVLQFEEFPDGRWAVISVATRRIRVVEWLDDDPYPRAMVADWPDDDALDYLDQLGATPLAGINESIERICRAAERIQPDRPVPPPILNEDPAVATWEAAAFAQLNPFDAMSLLRVPGAAARLAAAGQLIRERAEVLEALADQGG
ncbi:MAG: LON peptidase substrate-binding domain-containing protein [Acidimicrobiales bacterium]